MNPIIIAVILLISGLLYLILAINRRLTIKKHCKGMKDNQYITAWLSGRYMIVSKRNQAAHGPYTKYYSSGRIKEKGEYSYGELTGWITEYYHNGNIKVKRETIDGGLYIEYHKDGQIKEEKKIRLI